MQRGDDNIARVEYLVKCNLQLRYPALFNFIQSLIFFLNTLDKGTNASVNKQLQRQFTANNILSIDKMIMVIPLNQCLILKVDLGPVLENVHAYCSMIDLAIFYLEGILVNQIYDNKWCHHIII